MEFKAISRLLFRLSQPADQKALVGETAHVDAGSLPKRRMRKESVHYSRFLAFETMEALLFIADIDGDEPMSLLELSPSPLGPSLTPSLEHVETPRTPVAHNPDASSAMDEAA